LVRIELKTAANLKSGTHFSCGDDDDSSDCGFSALMEANDDFNTAQAAYSTDPSEANCQALKMPF